MSLTDDGQLQISARMEESNDLVGVVMEHRLQFGVYFLRQNFIFFTRELPSVIPVWLLPLLGLGVFGAVWDKARAIRIGYTLLMLSPAVIILLLYAHDRLFQPFVPLVIIWVAEGWRILHDKVTMYLSAQSMNTGLKQLLPGFISMAIVFLLLFFSVIAVLKQGYPAGMRQAGEWLKGVGGENKRIMSREFTAAYYARGDLVLLPYADYDAMTRYAKAENVDYLVTSRKNIIDWRPRQARLLGPLENHPEWNLIYSSGVAGGDETLIFALKK